MPSESDSCKFPLLQAVSVLTDCCGLRSRTVENIGKMGSLCPLGPFRLSFRDLWASPWGLLLEVSPHCLASHCQWVEFRSGLYQRKTWLTYYWMGGVLNPGLLLRSVQYSLFSKALWASACLLSCCIQWETWG